MVMVSASRGYMIDEWCRGVLKPSFIYITGFNTRSTFKSFRKSNVTTVKISQTNAIIGLAIALLAIILFIQSPPTGEDEDGLKALYTDEWITSPDPLQLGEPLGEKSVIGRLTSAKIPVTATTRETTKAYPDKLRGFSNVTVIERWGDEVRIVLLDEEKNPIQYPVTWRADK